MQVQCISRACRRLSQWLEKDDCHSSEYIPDTEVKRNLYEMKIMCSSMVNKDCFASNTNSRPTTPSSSTDQGDVKGKVPFETNQLFIDRMRQTKNM